jgi:choline dehydrogenase-like flavoprotein
MTSANDTNGHTNGTNGLAASLTASVEKFISQEYDFLVLGGGAAGLAVAARLTENPNVTVGVIEAGKVKLGDPMVDMPVGWTQVLENPEYDWCFYTEPQVRFFYETSHPLSF